MTARTKLWSCLPLCDGARGGGNGGDPDEDDDDEDPDEDPDEEDADDAITARRSVSMSSSTTPSIQASGSGRSSSGESWIGCAPGAVP